MLEAAPSAVNDMVHGLHLQREKTMLVYSGGELMSGGNWQRCGSADYAHLLWCGARPTNLGVVADQRRHLKYVARVTATSLRPSPTVSWKPHISTKGVPRHAVANQMHDILVSQRLWCIVASFGAFHLEMCSSSTSIRVIESLCK
ncbi:cytochrome P450 [Striga asiatica]|uniref:Cytochrome P450 n=1 Tax=Striga asiatica TaxID=4170 RepID=A0A5A7PDT0_STRAF|nr:cytochrome P450 [Striga asiatica]